jgi:hypothetical protein
MSNVFLFVYGETGQRRDRREITTDKKKIKKGKIKNNQIITIMGYYLPQKNLVLVILFLFR